MSNIIPMVSASPPPLEEAPSFSDAWDDEDSDFGNFTGADITNDTLDFSNCALPSPDSQSVQTNLDDADRHSECDNSLHKTPIDSLQFSGSACDSQRKPSSLDLPNNNNQSNGSVITSQTEEVTGGKSSNENCNGQSIDIEGTVLQSSHSQCGSTGGKRESTTDSGMCSTDISPIPISDNTADFCDSKSSCSDADEMFTEVQSDTNLSPENPSVVLDESPAANSIMSNHNHSNDAREPSVNSMASQFPPEQETFQQQGGEIPDLSLEQHKAKDTLMQNSPCPNESSAAEKSDSDDDDWSGFVDVSSDDRQENDIGSNNEDKTDVENCNVHSSKTAEMLETPELVAEVQRPVENSDHIDNSETSLSHDSDLNDNTDSESGPFQKGREKSDIEDLQLPDIEDEETSSEIKSESESEQLHSEHSSDAHIDSSPSEDCGTFQTASPGEEGSAPVDGESTFAAFPTDGNESDDNWADFSSTPVVGDSNEDDFGDFSQSTFSQDKTQTDSHKPDGVSSNNDEPEFEDNEDFGDFSAGAFQDYSSASTSTGWANSGDCRSVQNLEDSKVTTSNPEAGKAEKVGRVLLSCFPHGPGAWGQLGSFVELLDNIVDNPRVLTKLPNTLRPRHKQQSTDPPKEMENVWMRLRDMEKSAAGRYEWSDSTGNKKLFKTLKIDARNVLMWATKKPGIPLYAANLSLLEPMREEQKAAQEVKKVDTLVDTSKTDPSITAVTQDIPPVQFDWSGSGLTNPLDAKSSLLDLDLLAVNEGKSGGENKLKVFESDLLGGTDSVKAPPKTLQPLETILATMKFNPTIKQVKEAENLSGEAARVIRTLPDLSFMQAKVLMFPLRTVPEGSLTGRP